MSTLTPSYNQVFQLHWVYDYNDGTSTPINQLVDYANYKTARFNKQITIKIFPRPSIAAYTGPLTTGYGTGSRKQWIDCDSTNVRYYGFKYGVDNGTITQTMSFKIRAFFYMSFKGIR